MSFPGFYALSSAWFFLLLIPLLIFYFLKLKRPRQEIPSLALWRQVINDQRVNSPFQKFKRNLLLLLQTLLLLLLVLAAMQPFLNAGAERAEYIPVLLDCSASMAAFDKPGGQTRFDAAREQIRNLIENMLPDQRMSLIAVSSSARRLTEFTDNKRLLLESLDRLTVSDVPSQLDDALQMTQALSRTVPIESALFYSDGNFPEQVDFDLAIQINYQQLPPGGTNIGIVDFNARRAKSRSWDVFVRVSASDVEAAGGDLQLFQNGELIAEQTVSVEAGESTRLVFDVPSEGASSLEVRLEPDGFDALASDNIAWLNLPETRPVSVFVHPDMAPWRHAFAAIDNILLSPDDATVPDAARYDIVVTDQPEAIADVETSVLVTTGHVPPALQKLLSIETGLAEVVDWDRSDPLFQHVQLGDIQIVEEPRKTEGVQDGTFEELGFQILAHSRTGPLALRKRDGARISYHLLFHVEQSTLPYRIGFPVMVGNIFQVALQQASLDEIRGQRTGVLPPQTVLADREFTITGPDGERFTAPSDDDGSLNGVAATSAGRYTIADGGTTVASIGVSPLDDMETRLAAVEEIRFAEDLKIEASSEIVKNDRPFWYLLACIAFGLLLVEWWYYHRRPEGAPG